MANAYCITETQMQKVKGQRSKLHMTGDIFGGLTEMSFSTFLSGVTFLFSFGQSLLLHVVSCSRHEMLQM